MAPQVIDKGIPTVGLLAQMIVAMCADHLPLYRQEQIFVRAGLAIPRYTLASWAFARVCCDVDTLIMPSTAIPALLFFRCPCR